MGTSETIGVGGMIDTRGGRGVLVLCTANLCRSPMAAALLARRLIGLGLAVPVSSAGMFCAGSPALPEVVSVMAAYGLDISFHRSRKVDAACLRGAGLVLGMGRENLRHAVVTLPDVWPRAFTVKELIRRGEQIGPRRVGEPLAGWLSRAHAGRDRVSLLGESPDDDVADPVGGPWQGFADTAALLDRLVDRLADLCWGHAELAADAARERCLLPALARPAHAVSRR
jgi:protein-tyrosine phosphatase